jgi:hypothetical protein
LQAKQADTQAKACKRVYLPNRKRTVQTRHERPLTERRAATNSTYKKLAVQWLNEALCFVSSVVLADSLVLRIPPERQARKRYTLLLKLPVFIKIGKFLSLQKVKLKEQKLTFYNP